MVSTGILEATPWAIITQFYIALCCGLAALFLRKVPKGLSPHVRTLKVFWLCGYGFYFFTALGWSSAMFNQPLIAKNLAVFQFASVIIMSTSAGYYIVSLVSRTKFVKRLILALFGLVALFFTFLLITKSTFVQRDDIPFLTLPTAMPEGTVIFIFISLMMILSLVIFRRDLKEGKFSFLHPESFYEFYPVMIFGSLAGIRILYFLPRPSLLDIFFVLIPIIMYYRVKPFLKNKHDNTQ